MLTPFTTSASTTAIPFGNGRRTPLIDLSGKQFGGWTVLAMHPERLRYGRRTVHVLWLCRCSCGTERLVTGSDLRSGHTTQCEGCRREQVKKELRKRNTTHGLSRTRAFQCWVNMLQRCLNPNHPRYANYGGRGIGPCEYYLRFENFYADWGDPPPGLSINRIDNNGGYEPGNLGWATPAEQVHNRRPRRTRAAVKRRQPELSLSALEDLPF